MPAGVFSAAEIASTHFKTINFTGDWGKAIGKVSKPFHLLFWGHKGSGKSTLMINFAKYLAETHGMRVLYVAQEEGGNSYTVKDKLNRLSAVVRNLFVSKDIPTDAVFMRSLDVVIIDSVNSLQMTAGELEDLKNKYPQLATVSLMIAYKDGNDYKGSSDFGHNAEAVFRVQSGKWKAEKNRFGGSDEVDVKF